MKKQCLFLAIISLLVVLKVNSQSDITVEDERIYRRFSADQLNQWKSDDPMQIVYLNYLYKNSYVIKNSRGIVSPNIDPARTDIMNFDSFRKENERSVYTISPWGDFIELKSKKEVADEFEEIKKQYHDSNNPSKK